MRQLHAKAYFECVHIQMGKKQKKLWSETCVCDNRHTYVKWDIWIWKCVFVKRIYVHTNICMWNERHECENVILVYVESNIHICVKWDIHKFVTSDIYIHVFRHMYVKVYTYMRNGTYAWGRRHIQVDRDYTHTHYFHTHVCCMNVLYVKMFCMWKHSCSS